MKKEEIDNLNQGKKKNKLELYNSVKMLVGTGFLLTTVIVASTKIINHTNEDREMIANNPIKIADLNNLNDNKIYYVYQVYPGCSTNNTDNASYQFIDEYDSKFAKYIGAKRLGEYIKNTGNNTGNLEINVNIGEINSNNDFAYIDENDNYRVAEKEKIKKLN